MKRRIYRFFIGNKKFEREFKKQIRMLIIVTLGFTIAFTWRQTIFDLSQSLVSFFIELESNSALSTLTSIFITLVSILIIFLTAHYLKDKNPGY